MGIIDNWVDRVDGVDKQSAEDVNLLARGVKEATQAVATVNKRVDGVFSEVSEAKEDIGVLSEQVLQVRDYVDSAIQSAIYDSWGDAV